jgi:acetyltransferase-like isoleucine patch superfamily enzyme
VKRRVQFSVSSVLKRAVLHVVGRLVDAHIAQAGLPNYLVFGERDRLSVDPSAVLNDALINTMSGRVKLEKHAFLGHRVMLLTGTHDTTVFDAKRQLGIPSSGRDICIGRGAWVASGAIVLGPCKIGPHAVIGAGSLVNRDIPPFAIAVGSPARVIGYVKAPSSTIK